MKHEAELLLMEGGGGGKGGGGGGENLLEKQNSLEDFLTGKTMSRTERGKKQR